MDGGRTEEFVAEMREASFEGEFWWVLPDSCCGGGHRILVKWYFERRLSLRVVSLG